jgi:hypothetical protein
MTRRFTFLLLLSLAACGNAGPGSFREGRVPNASYKVPQDVFSDILARFPEGVEGRQELTLEVTEAGDGNNVVVLTIDGLLDDSIGAEQHRATLRFRDGGWRVTRIGQRWQCRRGFSIGWTTKTCG